MHYDCVCRAPRNGDKFEFSLKILHSFASIRLTSLVNQQRLPGVKLPSTQSFRRESVMKKFLIIVLTACSLLTCSQSFARGWHSGGYRGGYGFGFAPFVAGAVIGGAVVGAAYAAQPVYYSAPVQVINPAPVYVQPPISVPIQPHGYYCPTAQNYYPNVQTCNVPWQLVN